MEIIKDGRNTNGVSSLFYCKYKGDGIYDARISAKEMNEGDRFTYGRSITTIIEIKDCRLHKSDKSINVYDCLLKDESFISETNYQLCLQNINLP